MVKKITVFAVLAAMAIAAPTTLAPKTSLDRQTLDTRDFGFGGETSVSISASSGWSISVAGALAACRGGVAAGSVTASDKAALLLWLKGAGARYLDFATCWELERWCKAEESFVIGFWTQIAIDVSLARDAAVSAAGSVIAFLNGVIFDGISESTCLCSVLSGADQASLLTWLKSSAAVSIEATISGALHSCATGGIAASISSSVQASLSAWLSSAECSLSDEIKASIHSWLTISAKGSVSGGVSSSASFSVTLTSEFQSGLQAFIGGSLFGGLDISTQAALHACAAGGIASSLDISIKTSILSWISSAACTLDAELKAAIGLWLAGSIGVGVEVASIAIFPYVLVGAQIASNLEFTGYLISSARASLSLFCFESVGAALDISILESLKACAAGELAISLEASAAASLSAWLSSSACSLSAELRGTVIDWLSCGITGAVGAKAGVGIGAGAGYTFNSTSIASIQADISASESLSTTVKGAFGVVVSGQAANALSIGARSELSAFLCGTGASFGGDLHASLIGWICGSVGWSVSV